MGDLEFDFTVLSDPSVKSEMITTELEFFGKYLILTLGPTTKDNDQIWVIFTEL